jgi:hypothetical protein
MTMKRVIFLKFVLFFFLLLFLLPVKAQAVTISTTASEQITTNTTDANMQMSTKFVFPDSEGGVLTIWATSSLGVNNLYTQRYDSSLTKVWADDLTVVSSPNLSDFSFSAVADGSGGAVITWTDTRNSGTTGNDIYAQHIDKDGTKLWGAGDKVISVANKIQVLPDVYRTVNGNYYFAWRDCRNDVTVGCTGSPIDVYGQRLDSTGAAQWTEDGVSFASNQGNTSPQLYANQNSAVDVWLSSNKPLFKVAQNGSVASENIPLAFDYFDKDSSFNVIGLYTDVDDEIKIYKYNLNDMTDLAWGAPVDTNIDTNFLNDWHLFIDSSDSIYVAYEDFTNDDVNFYGDVLIKKYLSTGTVAWSGNATTILQTADDDTLVSAVDAGNNLLVFNSLQDPGTGTYYLHMHTIDTTTGTATAHSANPYFTGLKQLSYEGSKDSVYNNTSVFSLFNDESASLMDNLWLYLNTISAGTPTPTPTPTPTTAAASSQSFGPVGAPGCNDTKPIGQPFITKVEYRGNSATVYFAPATNNFNKYHIAYGTNKENPPYAFEFPSSVKGGIEKVDINYLDFGTRYFYKIRVGNGCNFGDWSAIYPAIQDSVGTFKVTKKALLFESPESDNGILEPGSPIIEVAAAGSLFWQQISSFLQIIVVKVRGLFK